MKKLILLLTVILITLGATAQKTNQNKPVAVLEAPKTGRLGTINQKSIYPVLDFNGNIDNIFDYKKLYVINHSSGMVINVLATSALLRGGMYAVIANNSSLSIVYIDSLGAHTTFLKEYYFKGNAKFVFLDDDGALKVGSTYTQGNKRKISVLWQTPLKQKGSKNSFLRLNADGNLVLYKGTENGEDGPILWSSETCDKCKYGMNKIRNGGGRLDNLKFNKKVYLK